MSNRTERACMLCGIIQTLKQFVNEGCPNCESILHFRDNDEGQVQECTSPSFEGLVAVGENEHSWVAKWLRINTFMPGLYAVKINGRLPNHIVEDLAGNNIEYRPRDGSVID